MTKQGTNSFRGSAFVFFQDAGMTAKDVFREEERPRPKPDTSQSSSAARSAVRSSRIARTSSAASSACTIDEGITVNVPARPEFNTTDHRGDARLEHRSRGSITRSTPSNTWGVRWLREYSPQFNQIIDERTAGALGSAREEDDLDQTVVGTAEHGARQHAGQYAAARVDAGGRVVRQPLLQRQRARPGGLRCRR